MVTAACLGKLIPTRMRRRKSLITCGDAPFLGGKDDASLLSSAIRKHHSKQDDSVIVQENDLGLRELLDEENNAHQVVVWVKSFCPYCEATKDLLTKTMKGLDVVVHNLNSRADYVAEIEGELQLMTGQRTVPKIFIHGKHISGGNRTLQELYHSDELEKMLFPQIPSSDNKTYRAVWKGTVLAESDAVVVVVALDRSGQEQHKGQYNMYCFPPESIHREYFRTFDAKSSSYGPPGVVKHYSIVVSGHVSGEARRVGDRDDIDGAGSRKQYRYSNAAWTLSETWVDEAKTPLRDYVCFRDSVAILKGHEQAAR